MRSLVTLMILLFPAVSAWASDGVLEINEACALQTGCFSGDSAGLPVTITQPGSYKLTGNLALATVNTTGISIAASDVRLDLNGFAIIGPVTCSEQFNPDPPPNSLLQCSGSGTGDAIIGQPNAEMIVIKNGTVKGAGRWGIVLQSSLGSSVDGVTASHNGVGNAGIDILGNVTNCVASFNANGGIRVQIGVVSGNLARFNGGPGIQGGSITVAANNVHENLGPGIEVSAATVRGNTVTDNAGDGIHASGIVDANEVSSNLGDGIEISGPSNVTGNTVEGNSGVGIRFVGTGAYDRNVINGNTGGTVVGGLQLAPGSSNFCNGNTTCP